MRRMTWMVVGWLALGGAAHAASFDCAKAVTEVEKLICGDAEISKLDEELSTAYKAALQDDKQAVTVKQAQKEWIKERNGCLDAACVRRVYEARLYWLSYDDEITKQVAEQTEVQVFPLDPKDPEAIRRGRPVPYVLVMNKDNELCNHMLQLFNEDLEKHGWVGSEFHDRHEEFKSIPWGKARYSYESDGRIQYKDVEGALFDFNNDGVQDFVVYEKNCCLSGMRFDEIFMLNAETNRTNDLTYKELSASKNNLRIAMSWGYPLSTPLDGQKEALWLLAPLRYHDTFYLFMRPVAVGYMSNFAVIAKYIGGKFVDRDMTGKMEDICYFQQNGAKRGN